MTIKRHQIVLLFLLILGLFLRLRGIDVHYSLASDSARDLLVAKRAVLEGQLPWVGSFSSAGPFVFGPNWYWLLMFWQILFPDNFLAPWLGMVVLSQVFIVVMYLVGKVAVNKKLGLFLALLAAVSPQVVSLSAYLTQHAMIEIFSALAFLGLISFVQSGRLIFAFLTAFSIGAAFSMHYQAINLFVYLPALFIGLPLNWKKIFRLAVVITFGFAIFPLPLFIWDASRQFHNLSELIYYFRVGQYRFWVSNRWLTYFGNFWPTYLGKFFSDSPQVGILVAATSVAIFTRQFLRRAVGKPVLFAMGIFLVQLVMLRYFRGEKYDGYLVYFHPLVIFLFGWVLYQISNFSKSIALCTILAVTFLSIRADMKILDWNNDGEKLVTFINKLETRYPNQKFSVFARSLSSSNCAYSFSALLEGAKLGDNQGEPIGICQNGPADCGQAKAVVVGQVNFQGSSCGLVDLRNVAREDLIKKNDWYNFSARAVYDDVQNWWKKSL